MSGKALSFPAGIGDSLQVPSLSVLLQKRLSKARCQLVLCIHSPGNNCMVGLLHYSKIGVWVCGVFLIKKAPMPLLLFDPQCLNSRAGVLCPALPCGAQPVYPFGEGPCNAGVQAGFRWCWWLSGSKPVVWEVPCSASLHFHFSNIFLKMGLEAAPRAKKEKQIWKRVDLCFPQTLCLCPHDSERPRQDQRFYFLLFMPFLPQKASGRTGSAPALVGHSSAPMAPSSITQEMSN